MFFIQLHLLGGTQTILLSMGLVGGKKKINSVSLKS